MHKKPERMKADVAQTQALYGFGLAFFIIYGIAAFLVHIIFGLSMEDMMPYGIIGAPIVGYFATLAWERRNNRSKL